MRTRVPALLPYCCSLVPCRLAAFHPHILHALCVALYCLWMAGEARGQVTFSSAWEWDAPLSAELSGGSAVPPTVSLATGSAQLFWSMDKSAVMVFAGLTGGAGVTMTLSLYTWCGLGALGQDHVKGAVTPAPPHLPAQRPACLLLAGACAQAW